MTCLTKIIDTNKLPFYSTMIEIIFLLNFNLKKQLRMDRTNNRKQRHRKKLTIDTFNHYDNLKTKVKKNMQLKQNKITIKNSF